MPVGVGVGATYGLNAEDEVTLGDGQEGREGQDYAGKAKQEEGVVEVVLPYLRQEEVSEKGKKDVRI